MMDFILKNKIVVGGIAIIVIVGGWYGLSGDSSAPPLLVTEDYTIPGGAADKELVATLLELRAVSLEGAVFANPTFQSLQDFGTEIVPEPVGRPNPFEPLNFGSAPAQTTESTSTPPKSKSKLPPMQKIVPSQ